MEIRKIKTSQDEVNVRNIYKTKEYIEFIKYNNIDISNIPEHTYILEHEGQFCGICEFLEIDTSNKNASVNVIFHTDKLFLNGKFLNNILVMFFREWKFNKLIFKVIENNKRMMNILTKSSIVCEGFIKHYLDSENAVKVYIFSMLMTEYLKLHKIHNKIGED